MYKSTKTFGHNLGLSSAFRQWKAESHCRFVHGYALEIRIEFEADELDIRNWVVDFGSLKGLKSWIEGTFDHKMIVAYDDPHYDYFQKGQKLGVMDVVFVEATGCEKFAELIYECTDIWLKDNGYHPRCRVTSVEVREHGANSAIYTKPMEEV